MLDVRPSPIAGKWYEGNAQSLSRSVDEYLERGPVAGIGWGSGGGHRAARGTSVFRRGGGLCLCSAPFAERISRRRLVAVIAPMHHPYREPLITTAHEAYATPLGEIPVDKDALRELDVLLNAELGFGLTPVQHDPEHSLEIELPFLQRALTSPWKLLPVMVRALDQVFRKH